MFGVYLWYLLTSCHYYFCLDLHVKYFYFYFKLCVHAGARWVYWPMYSHELRNGEYVFRKQTHTSVFMVNII